jgi:hypothetical protein
MKFFRREGILEMSSILSAIAILMFIGISSDLNKTISLRRCSFSARIPRFFDYVKI